MIRKSCANAIPMFLGEIPTLLFEASLLMKSPILIRYYHWLNQKDLLLKSQLFWLVKSPCVSVKDGWITVFYMCLLVEAPSFAAWITILSWLNHHFCWTSRSSSPSPEVLHRQIRPLLECLRRNMATEEAARNWRYLPFLNVAPFGPEIPINEMACNLTQFKAFHCGAKGSWMDGLWQTGDFNEHMEVPIHQGQGWSRPTSVANFIGTPHFHLHEEIYKQY
jgi:hypothetical protein